MQRPPEAPDDGLAVPRSFEARHGLGASLGVSLGGGGLFFVAWQATYLHELSRRGVDLSAAELVVGTSAGSLVASVMTAGRLPRLRSEIGLLARAPKLLAALAPASDLSPSQERARDLFGAAQDARPATIREIGHAALAADTPPERVMARNVALVLGARRWPAPQLNITCVDAFTGERCVLTNRAGVAVNSAVAASSAVPGLFPPQSIGGRRCMDGGVSGTGIHLDLLAGARRSLVLALTDGEGEDVGAMTVAPGSTVAEIQALRGSGTDVVIRMPRSWDVDTLMDPAAVPDAVAMAVEQAAEDADGLMAWLAGAPVEPSVS